jgi:hypothetical protein
MGSAALIEVEIEAGTDWAWDGLYEVSDPPIPVDLADGWTGEAFFWDASGLKLYINQMPLDIGQFTLGAAGEMHVGLTSVGTQRLTSSGEWLLQLYDPLGKIQHLIRGTMRVKQGPPQT